MVRYWGGPTLVLFVPLLDTAMYVHILYTYIYIFFFNKQIYVYVYVCVLMFVVWKDWMIWWFRDAMFVVINRREADGPRPHQIPVIYASTIWKKHEETQVHPRRWTARTWKRWFGRWFSFSKGCILRFHVDLAGCNHFPHVHAHLPLCRSRIRVHASEGYT